MTQDKKTKVVFMPGCFDSFEGTQEELDELIASIQKTFENPEEFSANLREVDLDELDDEFLEALADRLNLEDGDSKKLH